MAGLLVGLLAVDVAAVFVGAHLGGATGAATGALASAGAGLLVTAVWSCRVFGGLLVPARAAVGAVLLAALLHFALRVWTPDGWWVFVYGAGLYAIGLGALKSVGAFRVSTGTDPASG